MYRTIKTRFYEVILTPFKIQTKFLSQTSCLKITEKLQIGSTAGLQHILEGHAADLAAKGVSDVPSFLNEILQSTPNENKSINIVFSTWGVRWKLNLYDLISTRDVDLRVYEFKAIPKVIDQSNNIITKNNQTGTVSSK